VVPGTGVPQPRLVDEPGSRAQREGTFAAALVDPAVRSARALACCRGRARRPRSALADSPAPDRCADVALVLHPCCCKAFLCRTCPVYRRRGAVHGQLWGSALALRRCGRTASRGCVRYCRPAERGGRYGRAPALAQAGKSIAGRDPTGAELRCDTVPRQNVAVSGEMVPCIGTDGNQVGDRLLRGRLPLFGGPARWPVVRGGSSLRRGDASKRARERAKWATNCWGRPGDRTGVMCAGETHVSASANGGTRRTIRVEGRWARSKASATTATIEPSWARASVMHIARAHWVASTRGGPAVPQPPPPLGRIRIRHELRVTRRNRRNVIV
jgi:hypothetical protein